MLSFKYLLTITCLLFYLLPINISAQEWSEPVNISNTEFVEYSPDITITQDNIIHVVWSHKIETNYTKIYYSNSNDFGSTWSLPADISLNDEFECGNAHILHDSENNLFVSYEYDLGNPSQTKIILRIYYGSNWSDIIGVTDTMPGSDHSLMSIDKEDRLYVFWAYQDDKFYYKYYQNEIWSDVYLPFGTNGPYFINECVCDLSNNIHCIGSSVNPTLYYENITYYFYDFSSSIWHEPDVLTENVLYVGNDIDLNSNGEPNLVWRERTNSTPPYNDGTFYSVLSYNNWSIPELIVEDPWDQRIIIDKNENVNIFNREKTPYGSQLVHYLNYGSLWEGSIIDTSVYLTKTPQVSEINDELFVTYAKSHPSGDFADIWISKSDIYTGTYEAKYKKNSFNNIKMYPNPFEQTITFDFSLIREGNMSIYISDLYGNLVIKLLDEYKLPGKHEVIWVGTDANGKLLKNGIYLVRLVAGKNVITKSVEILR